MKTLKRTISIMITVAMLCACFSMSVFAASAELRFSDPDTTVGAEVTVSVSFTSDSSIQSMGATLSFDTEMLRFVGGGNAQVDGGTIKITGAGDGMSTQVVQDLTFQALAEGTTKIEVVDSEGVSTSGSDMYVVDGSSTITIGPGDPSLIKDETVSGVKIDVNGVTYTVSSDFSEALVPIGFVETETQFEGTTCKVVTQESSGTMAMFLVEEGANEGDFYLYDQTNGQFSPFEEVEIASDRFLIFLQKDDMVSVPANYSETTITISNSGKEFPAWQNAEEPEYYLVYGLNSDGEKALYQYDTVDGTYQRFQMSSVPVEEEVEEKLPEGLLGDVLKFVGENLMLALIVVAAAILFLILILIVIAIKLRHRNLELDDLYEEYGIDEDDDEDEDDDYEEPVKAKKEKKGLFGKKKSKDDDFDDFDEDDYDEDDFDEDDFDFDDEDDYDEDDLGFDDEDDDIDDLDELLNARVQKPAPRKVAAEKPVVRATAKPAAKQSARPAQKPAVKPAAPRKAAPQPVAPKVGKPQQRLGHSDFDDTFKMDLIDLD